MVEVSKVPPDLYIGGAVKTKVIAIALHCWTNPVIELTDTQLIQQKQLINQLTTGVVT